MTKPSTGFYFDEKCMWYIGQLHAGTFPAGGWVQPPNASGLAGAPDTKRRLRSLLGVSRLLVQLDVLPALRSYKPELFIIASGLDANCLDPRARMMLYSDSFRRMTAQVMALADEICGGHISVVHDGGYPESYMPLCGQAVIVQLSGISTAVVGPQLDFAKSQQPNEGFQADQRELLVEQAANLK